MKKTDIALIIIIISASAGLAWWIASNTIGRSSQEPIIVRTIEAINVDDQIVDERIFYGEAINPTVEATISGVETSREQMSEE